MVINDFNILSAMTRPAETDAPLIIDPDAVLSLPLAPQSFQPIAGGNAQVFETGGDLELAQLAARHDRALKTPDALSARKGFGVGTPKRSDHVQS
jgi:hypothetical protein